MINVSVQPSKLQGQATGEAALFSTHRIQFSGVVFDDHSYSVCLSTTQRTLLSTFTPATRTAAGIFVYADFTFDNPALELQCSGVTSIRAHIWLYDETFQEYLCYAPIMVMSAPEPEEDEVSV